MRRKRRIEHETEKSRILLKKDPSNRTHGTRVLQKRNAVYYECRHTFMVAIGIFSHMTHYTIVYCYR